MMIDQSQKLVEKKKSLESEIPKQKNILENLLKVQSRSKKIPLDYLDKYQLEKKIASSERLLTNIGIALTFNIGDRVTKIRNSSFVYLESGERKKAEGTVAHLILYNKTVEVWVKWDHLTIAPLPESPNNLVKLKKQ